MPYFQKMRTFFEEKDITILDWPGNSPDLNPIKNLRAIIKRRIDKTDCSTVQKLISGTMMMKLSKCRSKRLGSFDDSQQKNQSQYTAVHILIKTFR